MAGVQIPVVKHRRDGDLPAAQQEIHNLMVRHVPDRFVDHVVPRSEMRKSAQTAAVTHEHNWTQQTELDSGLDLSDLGRELGIGLDHCRDLLVRMHRCSVVPAADAHSDDRI